MKLILESDNLDIVDIPDSPQGNYWIKDGTRNVLNVESKDNNWVIKSNQDVNIYKNIFDNSKREPMSYTISMSDIKTYEAYGEDCDVVIANMVDYATRNIFIYR